MWKFCKFPPFQNFPWNQISNFSETVPSEIFGMGMLDDRFQNAYENMKWKKDIDLLLRVGIFHTYSLGAETIVTEVGNIQMV